MIKVAITGGIGSGKSTAANILKKEGYKCVSADEVYSEMLRDQTFIKQLSEQMGILPIKNGFELELDKKQLSAKVFSDKRELEKLNAFTHPLVMSEILRKLETLKEEKIVFAEVPLLFEGGFQKLFDKVIVIDREIETRIKQTMSRDGKTREEVERVVKNQVEHMSFMGENIEHIINDSTEFALKAKLLNYVEKAVSLFALY